MRSLIVFSLLILFISKSYCQFEDTYQPDSVYKVNRVKERISLYKPPTKGVKTVEIYNGNGQRIESYYTDISQKDTVSKRIFGYDSYNRLVFEQHRLFYTHDSITQKTVLTKVNPSVSPSAKMEYDSLQRIIRKARVTDKGFVFEETAYSYDPLIITKTNYNPKDSSVFSWNKSIYEKVNIPLRSSGYYIRKKVKTTVDFSYKNSFDEQGNLIKRIAANTDPSCNCIGNNPVVLETLYEYDSRGLLIKRTETLYRNNKKNTTTLEFDYTFW